jgi:hypothetical protein
MMSPADAFEPLRAVLEQAGIRYAIGGSWASTAFGEPRFTNDVNILGEFTEENVGPFLDSLPDTFYVDAEEALTAIRRGRSFNAIYMPMAFKFDFFPAAAFALGMKELDRAVYLSDTALSPQIQHQKLSHPYMGEKCPQKLLQGQPRFLCRT